MLEEIMTKDLLNFVKDMGTNFSYEWAQNGKIFMFHADAHQRTSTAEETLHNMDKIKCSVYRTITPMFAQPMMYEVGMFAGMAATHRLNDMDFP